VVFGAAFRAICLDAVDAVVGVDEKLAHFLCWGWGRGCFVVVSEGDLGLVKWRCWERFDGERWCWEF
jgi:hypothetical protein